MIYFYCILHLHCQFVGHICKIFLQHVKVVASVFENFITIRSKTNGVYRLQSGVPFGVLSSVRSGVRSGVRCPLRKWPVTFFEDTRHRTLGAKSDLCQGVLYNPGTKLALHQFQRSNNLPSIKKWMTFKNLNSLKSSMKLSFSFGLNEIL